MSAMVYFRLMKQLIAARISNVKLTARVAELEEEVAQLEEEVGLLADELAAGAPPF